MRRNRPKHGEESTIVDYTFLLDASFLASFTKLIRAIQSENVLQRCQVSASHPACVGTFIVACKMMRTLEGHFYARDYYTRSIIIDKIRRSGWHTRTKGVGCPFIRRWRNARRINEFHRGSDRYRRDRKIQLFSFYFFTTQERFLTSVLVCGIKAITHVASQVRATSGRTLVLAVELPSPPPRLVTWRGWLHGSRSWRDIINRWNVLESATMALFDSSLDVGDPRHRKRGFSSLYSSR